MKVWPLIERALVAHGTCAMVSVVKAEGSVPREEGARMIVTPDGFHGTIGGGTLEWKALAAAQALLRKAQGHEDHQAVARPRSRPVLRRPRRCSRSRASSAPIWPAFRNWPRAKRKARSRCSGRIAGLDVTESFGEQRRNVLVFGAGHVGRALVLALAPLPFDVTWVDPRPDAFPPVAARRTSRSTRRSAGRRGRARRRARSPSS